MKIKEIKANSASDTIVKQILRNIDSGDLNPGDKLPTQEKLGEMFGVGRSSIREATNALAVMGYLDINQGKGTFIKSRTPLAAQPESQFKGLTEEANLSNLIVIREVLECYVAEEAAARADDEQLVAMRRALNKLEECRENVGDFLKCDLKFHLTIADAGQNKEIGEIVKLIHNTTNNRVPVAFTTSKMDNIEKAINTARKAYTHIVNGEGKQAARSLRNHLAIAREDLLAPEQKYFRE